MRKMLGAKFLVICLAILGLLLVSKSVATEYEGDGTYLLRLGDRVRASNGYYVELVFAFGEVGSRSDWRTDVKIYNPKGVEVAYEVFFGNRTLVKIEKSPLFLSIERHVENEAVITVLSQLTVVPKHRGGSFNAKPI